MFAAFISTICSSLLTICVTAVLAFSTTIIFKTSYTNNFAMGSIAVVGCYLTADLLNDCGIPVYLGVFVGAIVGAAVSVAVDTILFRHGRNVNAVGKQMITMGLVSVIYGGVPLIFGTPESIPFEPFYNTQKAGVDANLVIPVGTGEIVVTKHSLVCLAITVVVLGALFLLLKFSKWGLAVRATASNEYTAELMSINTHVITALSWGIAGALCVLAAVMYAGGGTMISVTFMSGIQVNAFLACVLGGFATFHGPVIGAVCIPLAASCVGFLANFPALYKISRWNMVIVYVLVLLVILIKPNGLVGKAVAKKV